MGPLVGVDAQKKRKSHLKMVKKKPLKFFCFDLFEVELIRLNLFKIELFQLEYFTNRMYGKMRSISNSIKKRTCRIA